MTTSKEINRRLIADIRDEPKQMLKPISGYEHEPLVSIEEACKPLEDVLDHELKQNISIAKMNSTEPEHGLTSDEFAAIHLYTMEWDERENSLYMVLNRTLRLADRGKLRPWFKYLKLFLTGFFKLPSMEYQTVWRGVSEDLSAHYPKGKEFTWWALSSCTTAISVLESPLYVGTSGPRTMFSIETNSGKSIRALSYFQHEDEILLPPGRYLKVIDKSSPAPDLHIIHLREIQPPHPMLVEPFDLSQLKHTLPQPKSVPSTSIVEKKQENNSEATSAVPKSSVQVTTQNGKPQSIAPSSLYSQKKLHCNGRACVTCGCCRDWYWRPDGNRKIYTKRGDATCVPRSYAYARGPTGTTHYAHVGDVLYAGGRLCECDNNQ